MPLHFGKTVSLAVIQAPSDEGVLAKKSKESSEGWAAAERGGHDVVDPVSIFPKIISW